MRLRGVVTTAVLALLAGAPPAPSEDRAAPSVTPRPWRVLGGASLASAGFAAVYTSSYAPPLPGIPHQGSATQTLPLDASTGHGWQIGLERSLGAHVAIQLLGEYATSNLSGDPGHYDVRMVYTSRPPPSNEPVEVEARRSEARPEATGELETWAVALNLMAWVDAGPKARLGLSAGPAWIRTNGRAESLVYTTFTLGGHSVLFSDDQLVSFEFPTSGLGLDVGAFLEADLGATASLRVDARYFWAPERDAEVTVTGVVDLAPAALRVDPGLLRAAASLVIRF